MQRQELHSFTPEQRRKRLRNDWAQLLGDIELSSVPKVIALTTESAEPAHLTVQRVALEVEPDVVLPCMLLFGKHRHEKAPVVVMLAQAHPGLCHPLHPTDRQP